MSNPDLLSAICNALVLSVRLRSVTSQDMVRVDKINECQLESGTKMILWFMYSCTNNIENAFKCYFFA